MKKILITGGAGFIGSQLAIGLKSRFPNLKIFCLDNLVRRGSEHNIPRLQSHGIDFVYGDVRVKEDLFRIPEVDWLIECSAEPSVKAGYDECPNYVIQTNLNGALNCLEFLRQKGGRLLFLSSSRVYSIPKLREIPLTEQASRFVVEDNNITGLSAEGITEEFCLKGPKSLYGTTKYAAELFIEEYGPMYGLEAIVNRCGVVAGPWQMGKVDQGFMVHWIVQHVFDGQLSYLGFGGKGHQVRDVLHIQDLISLVSKQLQSPLKERFNLFNVGGGKSNSTSLCELTKMVSEITNLSCKMGFDPVTDPADIPYYVTDNSLVTDHYDWSLQKTIPMIVEDIVNWLQDNAALLKPLFKV